MRRTVESSVVELSGVFVRRSVESTAVELSGVFVRQIVHRIKLFKGIVIESSI